MVQGVDRISEETSEGQRELVYLKVDGRGAAAWVTEMFWPRCCRFCMT